MSRWEELDSVLHDLTLEMGGRGFILTDSSLAQLSPAAKQEEALIAAFDLAFRTLCGALGADFLRKGGAKRAFHHDAVAKNTFVAEPILGAYLLLVVFDDRPLSERAAARVLRRHHARLSALIEHLPPLGGGDRSVAARQPHPLSAIVGERRAAESAQRCRWTES